MYFYMKTVRTGDLCKAHASPRYMMLEADWVVNEMTIYLSKKHVLIILKINWRPSAHLCPKRFLRHFLSSSVNRRALHLV